MRPWRAAASRTHLAACWAPCQRSRAAPRRPTGPPGGPAQSRRPAEMLRGSLQEQRALPCLVLYPNFAEELTMAVKPRSSGLEGLQRRGRGLPVNRRANWCHPPWPGAVHCTYTCAHMHADPPEQHVVARQVAVHHAHRVLRGGERCTGRGRVSVDWDRQEAAEQGCSWSKGRYPAAASTEPNHQWGACSTTHQVTDGCRHIPNL